MARGPLNQSKKETKPSTPHPPYFQMVCDAISTMKDRTGSSQQAISKFIEEKYGKLLPENFKKVVSVQLRKFVKSEKLFKVKNSFKISPTEKEPKETKEEKKSNSTKKEATKKAKKTKRLSQVKTPEALKKKAVINKKATVAAKKARKM